MAQTTCEVTGCNYHEGECDGGCARRPTWLGLVPEKCDTCGAAIGGKFYDAATKMGPWACMCPSCQVLGPGRNRLGPGLGQEWTKRADGKYEKTAG